MTNAHRRNAVAMFAVVLLVCLLQSLAYASTSSTSKHGCAPPIPPTVAGSPLPAPATPGSILFNEILLNPASTWNCSENGTFSLSADSWVELYNPQNQPFDLSTVHTYLDTGSNTARYYLSPGSAIASHGFLVLFPRSFSFLPTQTPTLRLLIADVTIDQVAVPQLASDSSYARVYDGGINWQVTTKPTIDASNTALQATPTDTPRPKLTTPPATHTPSGTGNSGASSGTTGSGTGAGHSTPIVNGTQPGWNQLNLPPASSTPFASASSNTDTLSSTVSSSPPQSSDGLDLLHRVLLTVLFGMLALALFGCWKVFSR